MNRIEFYTYLCYACLALCILCLGVAAALFFYYDIRSVVGYLTGHSAKKGIKELEEETASSGRRQHEKLSAKKDKKKKESWKASSQNHQPSMGLPGSQQMFQAEEETEKLNMAEEILTDMTQKDIEETTALEQISFVIEREILLVHTNEVIS